jgi:hypothetical protein
MVVAAAQVPQGRTTAQAVLDRYVAALGGDDALQRIDTRVTIYKMSVAWRISGQLHVRQQRPDLVSERGRLGGWGWSGAVARGFDGMVGWAEGPDEPIHRMEGARLQAYLLKSRLDRDARLTEFFPRRTLLPDRTVAGNVQHVVELSTTFGTQEIWYFDAGSGLLVATDTEADRPGKDGAATVRTTLEDYRVVDGVELPFRRVVQDGKWKYALEVVSLSNNVALTHGDFVPPKEIRHATNYCGSGVDCDDPGCGPRPRRAVLSARGGIPGGGAPTRNAGGC